MPVKTEKFFCGMCGAGLEYGAAFNKHPQTVTCPGCNTPNPVYFHFCFRCGLRIIELAETETPEIHAG